VPVALDRLRDEMAGRPLAYLLTVTADQRPHCVAAAVSWVGDELVMGAGRSTVANAEARPQVSLLWPPSEAGGYTLIVDGVATAGVGQEGPAVRVRPVKAVLHRPAASVEPGASGCVSDCIPVYPGSPSAADGG